MPVLLIGTLDTKGVEIAFVRDRLRACGVETIVMDAGILGEPALPADVSRDEVFTAAGASLEELRASADRGRAVAAAAEGAARLAIQMHA